MRDYYLGLKLSESAVGWAVTDAEYNLVRLKGKDLWGVRKFDEAKLADKRRTFRINRRRRKRELIRIGLLKDYFHDAIQSVDPEFYLRLENSKYYLEDKNEKLKSKNCLFDDETYKDADYYREYPTIFHLRSALLHDEEKKDIRLIYLALLNMFKHRGNFLSAGLSSSGGQRNFEDVFFTLNASLMEKIGLSFTDVDAEKVKEILEDNDYSRSKKADLLKEACKIDKKEKQKQEFIKTICGLKTDVKKLFPDLAEDTKVEICFSSSDYEDKIQEILDAVGEEYYEIVELMKELYDICAVAKIMMGYEYLSDARIAAYEKHKADLKLLKEVIRAYESDKVYDFLFRSEEPGTYSAYVNFVNTGVKSRRNMKSRKRADLYDTLKKYIKGMPQDDERVSYIASEIAKETFLPKQLTAENGVIPNQIHTRELRKILENAEKHYSFLTEKDESGYTVSERILKLFTFQMPYYIGPTSEQSKTGWIVRKEDGPVLPWNLEDKIDVKETSEKFISRMVRRCTYLNGEMVLPKASLLYERYCVLNEINCIEIQGKRISVQLKQQIYNDLFKKGKKVSRKQIAAYLISKGVLEDESYLSGIDTAVNSSLSTYGKFRAILGEQIEEEAVQAMVDQIVFWGTVYGNSKKFLQEKIEETYGEYLTKEEMKRIIGMKFNDWGKLSKEFLELPGCDVSIGEKVSLLQMMWDTNLNLMELIKSKDYTYKMELSARQDYAVKSLYELCPEDLDQYYYTAPVKRTVWQTILLIREIEEILGCQPKRVFLEMTKKAEDTSKASNRKQKFLKLYKKIKSDGKDWKKIIENADADGTLRSKKMYLYLTQMGRCMYSGEEIKLEELFDPKKYNIDHIYPRHYVKDENLNNNLVLVRKDINEGKEDDYPLPENIYKKQKDMWKSLLDNGLITEEKYKRLICQEHLTEEQKADAIAQQLVEISYGTKSVGGLLDKVLPGSVMAYAKSSNVSEFRQKYGFPKCRSVNELYHAHDAYLNIVVGNVYYVKFTQNPLHFIQKEYRNNKKQHHYNLSRMFDWDVTRNEETAWVVPRENSNPGTIATVQKTLKKNTPLMTRRNFEGHGELYNGTLYSKKRAINEKYIPLKSSDEKMLDMSKYGGYTSVSTAYFFLVEHTKKKERIRTLETVPMYMASKIEKEPEALLRYCVETLGLIDPDIRLAKIKLHSLIKRNGYFMHISGKTGNQISVRNAVNLCLKNEWMAYIKHIEKCVENAYVDADISSDMNVALYRELADKFSDSIFAKRQNPMGGKLKELEEGFISASVMDQCKTLAEILKLSGIGVSVANLEAIGGKKTTGVMQFLKEVTAADEFLLICQSVTGIYEKQIDLLTI